MNKRLLLKVFLLCLLFCQVVNKANAQYAVGGTANTVASPNMTGSVYWLTFGPASTKFKPPAGYTLSNGVPLVVNGDYEWYYSSTVTIKATISGLQFLQAPGRVLSTAMPAYTPGDFYGDGLDVLYNGNGITTKPADENAPNPTNSNSRGVPFSAVRTQNGGELKFNISIKVYMKINGVDQEIAYPGMLIADAEALAYSNVDGTTNYEYISGTTNAVDPNTGLPIGWYMLNLRKDTNKPTKWQYYMLTLANSRKDFKLSLSGSAGTDPGIQAVMYANGAQEITNLSMRGDGKTAIAIGFVFPFDLGDAPTTYGRPEAYINKFDFTKPTLTDGTFQVVNLGLASLKPVSSVYLGANNVDGDGDNTVTNQLADLDNAVTGLNVNDEASINASGIAIKVNQAGDIEVPITSVTNDYTAKTANIYGWIDFNGDGKFQETERATTTVAAATTSTTSKLIFSNANFKNTIKAGNTFARFRVTTSTLTDVGGGDSESATSSAEDGEIEDYVVTINGVTISGNIFSDANGAADANISGLPLTTLGSTQLYAYLVDNSNSQIIKSPVTVTGGAYSFTGVNNGAYKVAISTIGTKVVGDNISTIPPTLPSGWTTSVDGYGTNNAANTLSAVDDGAPNLQVLVMVPNAGQDVTGVNFGIDANPIAVADGPVAANTNAVTPVDVTANDTDADGNATINKSSVLIETATNSGTFTQGPITVSNVGTFTLNAATGVVSFISAGEFVGTASIRYTVKDNFGAVSAPATLSFTVKIGGQPDPISTTIGTPVSYNVQANDGFAANNGLTTTVTPQAGVTANGGTAVIDPGDATKVKYTPSSTFVGVDTYTYTLTKNSVVSDPITVTVTVKPIGVADPETTLINTPVVTAVTSNDGPSVTLAPLDPTSISTPTSGTAVIDTDPTKIKYTPATDFVGVATYTYKLKTTAGGVLSDPITVTVNVKPTGVADPETTPINTPVITAVTGNDGPSVLLSSIDPTSISTPSSGTAVIDVDPAKIKYTPGNNFVGIATYTYKLKTTAGGVLSDPITVTVNVKPTGVADPESTPINTPVITAVTGNDGPSVALAPLDPTSISTPTSGTAVIDTDPTKIKYTPATDFVGVATYTYNLKTTAGGVLSDPIMVTVNVKPTGVADPESTFINTSVTTAVTGNDGPSVLLSSIDPTSISTPSSGTAVIDTDPTKIKYTPANNFVGVATYTYKLKTAGGVLSDPITVTVTVKPTGQPDADNTTIGVAKATNVLTGTPGGTDSPGSNPGGATTITDIVKTTNATSVAVTSANTITYTPATNFIGVDTYTYRLTSFDGVKSDPITVTMTVKPKGVNDVASTDVNIPVSTIVTDNDGFSGTATVVVAKVSDPIHGNITLNGSTFTYTPNNNYVGSDTYTYTLTKNLITSDPITVTVNVGMTGSPDDDVTTINTPVLTVVTTNDGASGIGSTVAAGNGSNGTTGVTGGTVTYTPNSNFIGIDTYTYTLTKNNATSAPITVTITVKPKGVADAVSTVVNTPVPTVVTSNDGPSGVMTVTVTKATDPLHGSIAVSGTTITYTPNTGYIGTDSFTYILTKNTIVSDPITVSVTVTPPIPVGVNDNDLTPVNTPVTTDVIANDGTDGIGATVVSTAGSHGATTVSGGNVTYTPANGYIGTDTYTYTLTKNSVTSAPITVTINVYSATMSLSKVANNGGTKAGDVINYTLIVKNTGTVALTNIMLTDAGADAGSISPASIATLAPGASTTITANHTVVAADVTAGKFSNQATATAKDPKNNPVSKISDDPSTTIFDDPTVVPITPAAPASVNLAKTGVFSGNQVSYTFIITNNGGVPLNTITLTDAKLGLNGVTITTPTGGLLPNASLTYNAAYTLTQADKDAGVVNNTATVNAKDPSNNTITGTGSTVTTVPTSPVATNDAAETNSGTPVIVSVLTNDDPKNSTFNLTTLEIVGNPMHGTVAANANGTVTYTPTAGYNGTDSFTYRVKDAYGYATNTATVTITTNLIKELKIPSLFSPNGDGVNDGFVIKDLGEYAQNELIVLNRWGNEVYRQANYQNTWSGTGLNEGTYFYIVRLKKANGDSWVIKKGYVTLIRTFKK